MYSFESRIRYSEVDKDGRLTLEELLDYFQDCSTFHSEDIGVGTSYLAGHNMVWVLSAWQIVVDRYPKLGERVTIGTFPYDFKGFLGYRNFVMQDETGKQTACANSVWTLLDLEKQLPTRPTPLMVEKYVLEDRLPMDYAARKIAVPKNGEKREEIIVKKYHLDTNNHVNNGQYVRMAMDFLPDGFKVSQMRAEYKKQALLEDMIIPETSDNGNQYTVCLNDSQNNAFAVVEFTKL